MEETTAAVVTNQEKVSELSKIINQIFNFLREAIHLLEQAIAGIEVKYGWQEDAE